MNHILLVEDDTALREGLITALQSDSIAVHAAADLAEADASCVSAASICCCLM